MCDRVEVFSVTYKGGGGEAPTGTISVFDGKRGQILYRHERDQIQSSWKPSESGDKNGDQKDVPLLLTGPYRAISADGCVAFVFDLHHEGCKDKDEEKEETPWEIIVDIYDPSTRYDEAITEEVHTCSCQDGPVLEIKYALLTDAVEAIVEAELHPIDPAAGCSVYIDKIVAIRDLGNVVLFQSFDESTQIRSIDKSSPISIPLARSVLSVPLTSLLTINVELRDTSDADKKSYLKSFEPDMDEEYPLSFNFPIGTLKVKITCSD